jgi:hypothetical protein
MSINVISNVVIKQVDFPTKNNYRYIASIYRSIDGGKNFYYQGEEKYCYTYKEAKLFKLFIEKK